MKNPFRSRETAALPIPEMKTAAQPLIALQLGGGAHWTPREFTALCREGYARNPVAYRCVRMISEAAASVPFQTRRSGQILADDPAARFLTRSHPQQSATETMEAFYGYLQVGGNAYLEAVLSSGVPIAMQALRHNQMKIALDKSGRVLGWDFENGRHKRRYNRDAASGRCGIHHMRGALIYSGGQGERLTDEQFDRLKSELEGNFTGPRHAGRPMVLEGGLDWKSMSMSPSDMDFTQTRREAARDIALAFGVPPMLLGIPGDNSYANYKEANQAFCRQTIIPLVRKTARGLRLAWSSR